MELRRRLEPSDRAAPYVSSLFEHLKSSHLISQLQRVKSLKLSYAMASETPDLGDLKILENVSPSYLSFGP